MIQAISGLAKAAEASDAATLAASYGSWTGVRSNHVLTLGGAFVGSDGSSRSISTKEDLQLLLSLRSSADLILVDAATARMEKYQAPSSGAALGIFSASGRFDQIPAVDEGSGRVFLFTKTLREKRHLHHNLLHVEIAEQPFAGFLDWAAATKLSSVLLEAGPTLTKKAFEAGIVRQSAITRTPLPATNTLGDARNPFDNEAVLESLAVSQDASFSLWSHSRRGSHLSP